MTCSAERGIREIWREVPGDFYSPSIEAFAVDGPMKDTIRINVGGSVVTMPVRQWHRNALHGYDEIDHGFRIREVEKLTAELASLREAAGKMAGALKFYHPHLKCPCKGNVSPNDHRHCLVYDVLALPSVKALL